MQWRPIRTDGGYGLPFLENLSEIALQDTPAAPSFTSVEVDQVIDALARSGHDSRNRHNPVLVGHASQRRSDIVAEVVRRLALGTVPMEFGRREVWELKLDAIVASTIGTEATEAQELLTRILECLRGTTGHVVLVVNEFHRLVGGYYAQYQIDVGPWLKPVLARGELQFLGTASLLHYQRFIEADSALERRVCPILMG